MHDNEKIRQKIIDIITQKDVQQSEEYIRKISRNELTLELLDKGLDQEGVELQLKELCDEGSFVMDEQNIYQYEET